VTRIAITGGPRTGKTTLAARLLFTHIGATNNRAELDRRIRHTDDLIHLGWSEASQAAAAWFDEPGPWIIEGVAVSRALRKWRDQHPGEPPPVDRVIYLSEPHERLTAGQRSMAAGVATVHAGIEDWLGDRVEYRTP
jgi:hypothetical protein